MFKLMPLLLIFYFISCSKINQSVGENAKEEYTIDSEELISLENPVIPEVPINISNDDQSAWSFLSNEALPSDQGGGNGFNFFTNRIQLNNVQNSYGAIKLSTKPGNSYKISFDLFNDNIGTVGTPASQSTPFEGIEYFVFDGEEFSLNPSSSILDQGASGTAINPTVIGNTLELNFVAISNESTFYIKKKNLGSTQEISNLTISDLGQANLSSFSLNFNKLFRVGDTRVKRLYLKNNTTEALNLDDDFSANSNLSILKNTCGSSVQTLCYLDIQFSLNSLSDTFSGFQKNLITNPPLGAGASWSRVSISGSFSGDIDDGNVKASEILLSENLINFGQIQAPGKIVKRFYISNLDNNDLNDLDIVVDSPFLLENNSCTILKGKRVCYAEISYTYNSGEQILAGDNKKVNFSHPSLDLSSLEINLLASSLNALAQDDFSINLDLSNEVDKDYSSLNIGETRTERYYFSNSGQAYDFGEPSSVQALGDLQILRNTCEGIISSFDLCYVDVEYIRKNIFIDASDVTKLVLTPNLEINYKVLKESFLALPLNADFSNMGSDSPAWWGIDKKDNLIAYAYFDDSADTFRFALSEDGGASISQNFSDGFQNSAGFSDQVAASETIAVHISDNGSIFWSHRVSTVPGKIRIIRLNKETDGSYIVANRTSQDFQLDAVSNGGWKNLIFKEVSGKIYLAGINRDGPSATNNQVRILISADDGLSWTSTVAQSASTTVFSNTANSGSSPFYMNAVSLGAGVNRLYVVLNSSSLTTNTAPTFLYSDDDGVTWETAITMPLPTNEIYAIGFGQEDNKLALQLQNLTNNTDRYLIHSDDLSANPPLFNSVSSGYYGSGAFSLLNGFDGEEPNAAGFSNLRKTVHWYDSDGVLITNEKVAISDLKDGQLMKISNVDDPINNQETVIFQAGTVSPNGGSENSIILKSTDNNSVYIVWKFRDALASANQYFVGRLLAQKYNISTNTLEGPVIDLANKPLSQSNYPNSFVGFPMINNDRNAIIFGKDIGGVFTPHINVLDIK